jgi:hypothetical protein
MNDKDNSSSFKNNKRIKVFQTSQTDYTTYGIIAIVTSLIIGGSISYFWNPLVNYFWPPEAPIMYNS